MGKTAEPSSVCAGERGRAGDMKAVIAMGEGGGPCLSPVGMVRQCAAAGSFKSCRLSS